jgi:lipopolysaccharide/colanic/teichoic acid biosynthesis glycosyltransferase
MRRQLRRQAVLLVDLVLVACATALALVLRDNMDVSAQRLGDLVPYLATSVLMAAFILSLSGVARSMWRFSGMADYLRILSCAVLIVLTSVAISFLTFRLDGVARALPVIQGLLIIFLLIGARVATRLKHVRRQARRPAQRSLSVTAGRETVLVVGLNVITELFVRSVAEFSADRTKIAGILGRTARHSGRRLSEYQVLGIPEDIKHVLKTLEVHGVTVHRIVITTAFSDLSAAAQQALLDIEKRSDIRLDFFAERVGLDGCSNRAPREPSSSVVAAETPVSHTEIQELSQRPYFQSKRAIDLAAGALFAVVGIPVMLLVAIVVSLDVGLPIVFWQQRPGFGGRPFKLYKFRTMRGAHDRNGRRIPDDQRLTMVGSVLRRTRLDELPQLYNILTGDMSFVGPRPLLPIDQSPEFAARLFVRPGLTGWAQVAGGRDLSAPDKAMLDIWYIRNASFWLDLLIIVRTARTIARGEELDAAALRRAWSGLDHKGAGRGDELASPLTIASGMSTSQHAA